MHEGDRHEGKAKAASLRLLDTADRCFLAGRELERARGDFLAAANLADDAEEAPALRVGRRENADDE
jgi:hypothetical protein